MQDIRDAAKRSDSDDGALVCSLIAAILTGIAVALRTGFPDLMATTALRALGLSWFLLHFPWLVGLVGGRHSSPATDRAPDRRRSEAPAMLAGLALAAFGGFVSGRFEMSIGPALLPMGAALFAARLVQSLLKRSGEQSLLRGVILLAAAGFLSLYAAGAVWGSGYQNPLFVERLASGYGHIDTLFHATLSNMIRTHGVPSTGLDGLPFLHYHFGSHWLFAMLCNLLGIAVIDFYNIGYAIVFVPFLVQSIVIFANDIAAVCAISSSGTNGMPQGNGFLFWFAICLGFAGFLPLSAAYVTSTSRTSILVSESYGVGVAISLLTISAAVVYFQRQMRGEYRLTLADIVVRFFVFPLLFASIGLTKISIMLVVAVAAVYAYVRLGWYWIRSGSGRVGVPLLLFAAGVSFKLAYSPGYGNETGLQPLGFLRGNVDFQWWGLFWIAYFAWFWIAVVLRVRQEGISTVGELIRAIRERRLIDIELLTVVAVSGAMPGLILSHWSSTHFFSDYQNWLALGLVLAIIRRRDSVKGTKADAGWRGMSVARLGATIAGVVLGGTMLLNTVSLARQMMNVNLASRGYPAGNTGVGSMIARGEFSEAHATLTRMATDLRKTLHSQFQLLETLREFDRMPLSEKRATELHISKRNTLYWELTESPYAPHDAPFVAPALSGLMMVDGLYVPSADDRWSGYGYQTYPRPAAAQLQRDGRFEDFAAQRSLCDRARQLGCRKLFEIGTEAGSELEVRRTDCR